MSYLILIVEDSRTQAAQLEYMMEEQKWQAIVAYSAKEAFDLLAKQTPDLIIVDFYLPDMRGDIFCKRVRLNESTRSVPIVIRSMEGADKAKVMGLEGGADEYLTKNDDDQTLLLRVQSFLPKVSKAKKRATTESAFTSRRIIAVDDSLTYLEHLRHELSEEGYDFAAATNSQEAMLKIKNEHFDCIIVDFMMPEVDGLTLCRQIVESKSMGERVPILMVTGKESSEVLSEALSAGADDFVSKNADINVLKARVRALLRRRLFEEQNQKILSDLKQKELEVLRSKVEKEVALAKQIAQANSELEAKVQARTRQLEIANKDLEAFANTISHDLRAPLNHVGGFLQRLRSSIQEPTSDQQRYLKVVDRAVAEMRHMIESLLQYFKAGRSQLKQEIFALGPIIEELIAMLMGDNKEHKVEWKTGDLGSLCGDPSLIKLVFQNLLSNSMKYSARRDPAVIEIFRQESDNGFCILCVRDNGVGFDKKYAGKLFEAFARLHSHNEFEGTGLGLANAARIVSRHQGKIWAEAEEDKGASFFVSLPTVPFVPKDEDEV